jgi:hypothetical protein
VRSPRATRHCRDARRRESYPHTSFTFLGYTFRARTTRGPDGKSNFTGFNPAISKEALKKLNAEVRGWRLPHRSELTLADLARKINPIVRGWMLYYGRFYRSAVYPALRRINSYLVRCKHSRGNCSIAVARARSCRPAHACEGRTAIGSCCGVR